MKKMVRWNPSLLFLSVFFSIFLLTACHGEETTEISKTEIESPDISSIVSSSNNAVSAVATSDNATSQNSNQPPALPSDQSAANPTFSKVYAFLSNLAKEEGTLEGDRYSYQFKDGVFIMAGSKDDSLTFMEVQYRLKCISSFSMIVPKSLTTPYTFWYQEYEYEDESNTPITSASSLINPILYHGAEDISIISDSFSSWRMDTDDAAYVMADIVPELLYMLHHYLLFPNGYSIDQLGFVNMLQEIQEFDEDEVTSLRDDTQAVEDESNDEVESSVSPDDNDEDVIWVLDDENFLDVNVDGVDKIFYLARSYESAGGDYWFTTYTVPNTNGEKLSIMLDPEMKAGETRSKPSNRRGSGFEVYYSADGIQTRYANHGDWEVTMEEISADGKHMAGTFWTSAELVTGGRPIEIYGAFFLNFGESVPEAKAIYDERNGSAVATTTDDVPTLSWDETHKTECLVCKGTKKCTGCGGWGRIDTNGDGILDQDCDYCHRSGLCYLCHGRGYTTF